jgi:hypothetical protein
MLKQVQHDGIIPYERGLFRKNISLPEQVTMQKTKILQKYVDNSVPAVVLLKDEYS